MVRFIDSHAHLADPAFDSDRNDVIARARDAGAVGIVCIGESVEAAERARRIAGEHPSLIAWTAGVHPHDAGSFRAERDLDAVRRLLSEGAGAVGECGLDYHYENSPRDAQRSAFGAQLELAAELGVPVVVHTRDAVADTMAMVSDAARAGVRGVLHCFTGPAGLAETAITCGWSLSFSGVVTFRNWSDESLLRMVPDELLLVESDSPYLAPVPRRGKRNEPAWVEHTLRRVAAAREVTAEQLGDIVCDNAARLFGLAPASSS